MWEDHHRDSSKLRFGKPYAEVHAFLDQFFPRYWAAHRRLLHNRLGVALIAARFGEEAGTVAEVHILEDLLARHKHPDLDPAGDKWQELRQLIPATWRNFGDPAFHMAVLYTKLEKDLVKLYGKEVVRAVENREGFDRVMALLHEKLQKEGGKP